MIIIYFGNGDILLEIYLVGVSFFWVVMGCSVSGDLSYNWELCGFVSRWWYLNDSVIESRNRGIVSYFVCYSNKYCIGFYFVGNEFGLGTFVI